MDEQLFQSWMLSDSAAVQVRSLRGKHNAQTSKRVPEGILGGTQRQKENKSLFLILFFTINPIAVDYFTQNHFPLLALGGKDRKAIEVF